MTSLENYVKGVVPREIPATWSPAAVQAQAVAARTYAAYERAHPLTSRYQICDTTSCQVYGGKTSEHPASNRAVNATRGQVRTYKGEPAFTQFSSSQRRLDCRRDRRPYLVAKPDPYDGWSGNPNHTWLTKVTDTRIENAFPRVGNLRRIVVIRRDGNGQWGGRVAVDAPGRQRRHPDDLRRHLPLHAGAAVGVGDLLGPQALTEVGARGASVGLLPGSTPADQPLTW